MKKIIWLLPVICTLFTLSACSKQQGRLRPVIIFEKGENADLSDIVLENEFLELRFLPETAEIILKDKERGTLWHSNPPDIDEDILADVVTKQLMESQFSLQYADVSGVGETLYSGMQSVELGFYEYEVINNYLEVRYAVGNLTRSYIIPIAMQEERMKSFMSRMEMEDWRKVEASYRLYDINLLLPNDNKTQLLADYPELANGKLYVLRETTQEYMKEQFEVFFADAGYTREEYYEDLERYTVSGKSDNPAFNIVIRYSLEGKSLVVNVPFDKIAYRATYPVIHLNILPFMGAGSIDDEGYLLVPDGSGALIYFNNGKHSQLAYNNSVYGWDEGMPRDVVVTDSKASFPVFGIQKNGEAMLCVIEEGSAYASVLADVSRRNCSYNSIYSRFTLVHGALMDISGRSDRAVYLYESGLPSDENITLRYTLCGSDGYTGMAKEYRSYLLNKYPSLGGKKKSGVPVAVEIVGAVNKTQHRLGIPFDLPLRLTSYKETENIINDLANFGWKNVQVKLNGWFNRSVDHSVPTKVKLIKELGSKRDFINITSAAKKNNFDLYPEADFLYIKDIKLFDKYSLYRDSARYVNRKRIEKYPYSFVWYGERTFWGKLSHIARPASMFNMIDSFSKNAAGLELQNIAFRNMGSRLSGDYNEKRAVSRQAAIKLRQSKLAELDKAGTGIMLNSGFDYSVPWADFIVDMAINDQGFGITDTAVPFYQIVLHGLVPYTGRAINLAEDYTKNLLKTIETGAGLYFSFMHEEAAVLQETKFRQFYANDYDKWIGDADTLYRRFSADFAGLYSQAIVDHIILAPGVTVTQYEDGTRVIVNVSGNPWTYNGVTIETDNYIVLTASEGRQRGNY